jgi:hypothetical protein
LDREHLLPIVLRVSAVLFLFAPSLGFIFLPAEFRWAPHNPPYERMIIAIYIALGACLWRAARDPWRHLLLIDFTILSSVLHGGVMLYDAVAQEGEHAHLWFAAAALLWWLRPSGEPSRESP